MPAALLAAAVALAAAAPAPAPAQSGSAAVAAPAGAPVDADRLAVAEEVVALAFPVERRREMFAGMTNAIMSQMREAAFGPGGHFPDPGAEPIMEHYFSRVRAEADRLSTLLAPDLFAAVARAYARTFTRDELVQIRAFVATPAGAKYVQRSADILSDPDVAAANTAHIQRTLAAIKPLEADLRRELEAYFAKHPPKSR
jgi:hypothetical protein